MVHVKVVFQNGSQSDEIHMVSDYGNFVDTVFHCQDNDWLIGKYLHHPQNQVAIATKHIIAIAKVS